LTTCNKIFDSNDGCAGRNRQFRFGGAIDKGELERPFNGDIDTEIGDLGRFRRGQRFPDPINGRHQYLTELNLY
jgi:hypothetical protein